MRFSNITLSNSQSGFSLIELSIIISIAATLLIGYLSWTQPKISSDAKKAIETRKNINEIINSIESFVVNNKRLPCPADPNILQDNSIPNNFNNIHQSKFAIEALDTDEVGDHENLKTLGIDCPNNLGIVPVSSLGLPIEKIYDGWGRYITYHVATTLCGIDRGTDKNNQITETSEDFLSEIDSRKFGCTDYDYGNKEGNILITTDGINEITKNAAIVVLSHGANGNGAFLPGGGKISGGSAYEIINSNNLGTNLDKYVKAEQNDIFDDILLFRSRYQIEKNNQTKYNSTSKGTFFLSIAQCNENSIALSEFTYAEAESLDFNLPDYAYLPRILYADEAVDGYNYGERDSGHSIVLSILKTVQDICVQYYGVVANGDWIGAQCPGNSIANASLNGSTYNDLTGSCSCQNDSWNGNCTAIP